MINYETDFGLLNYYLHNGRAIILELCIKVKANR